MRDVELKKYVVPGKVKADITLIGDLHYTKGMEEGFLSQIVSEIKEDKSTVCFVGDILHEANIIEDEQHRNIIRNFMKELAQKHNINIILGNHDVMSKKDDKWVEDKQAIDFYETLAKEAKINFLDNTIQSNLNSRNTFVGVNPGFDFYENENKKEDKEKLLQKLKELKTIRKHIEDNLLPFYEQNNILLMHSPYLSDDKEIKKELRDYDLVLCGHMHNGCVPEIFDNKEGNKGIISPYNDLFCDNARGYKVISDNSHLIITGGLTKIAGDSKLKRFLNGLFPVSIDKIAIREDAKELISYKSHRR